MFDVMKKIARCAMLAPLFAAACDEAPSTREVYVSPKGTLAFLRTAAGTAPGIPVFVDADPFDEAQQLSESFAEAMRGATRRFQGLHFSAAGVSENVTVDRVVVVFDIPKGKTGMSICKGEAVGGSPDGDKLNFRAVLCRGAERMAEAEGRMPQRPSSAGDAALKRMFEDAAKMLVQDEDRTPN